MKQYIDISRTLAVLLCAANAVAGPDSTPLEIVRDGVPRAEIVVATDAPPHTRLAAEDLAHYVERITGAALELVDAPGRFLLPIWIGDHPARAAHLPGAVEPLTKPDELRILVRSDALMIEGRDRVVGDGQQIESGTAHAVYTFARDTLGVRWLWPAPLGEEVPRRETLAIPLMDVRYAPPLRQRQLRMEPYSRILRRRMRDTPVPGFVTPEALDSMQNDADRWPTGPARDLLSDKEFPVAADGRLTLQGAPWGFYALHFEVRQDMVIG